MNGLNEMCRRFATQHIGYWRSAKRQGLKMLASHHRQTALWWLEKARGAAK